MTWLYSRPSSADQNYRDNNLPSGKVRMPRGSQSGSWALELALARPACSRSALRYRRLSRTNRRGVTTIAVLLDPWWSAQRHASSQVRHRRGRRPRPGVPPRRVGSRAGTSSLIPHFLIPSLITGRERDRRCRAGDPPVLMRSCSPRGASGVWRQSPRAGHRSAVRGRPSGWVIATRSSCRSVQRLGARRGTRGRGPSRG